MPKSRRDGSIVSTLFFLLILLAIGAAAAYYGWKKFTVAVKVDPPQLVGVKRDLFVHEILERGSVDSASNVEIRCQVESAGGLTIISVVPEGAVVKKGDLLVELDSSTLRENVTKQRIAVAASQSKLAQSEADLETARLTLSEYLDGKFNEEKKVIENDIAAALEKVRATSDEVFYNKKLLERGYITESQFIAGEYALKQAVNERDIADLRKSVLIDYTSKKNIVQYEAAIKTNEAKVASDGESLKLDQERLVHLERQLELCKVIAPQDGQVVYYMPRWGGEEDLIKEGKKVVERQILIKLPDPSQMQVKGLVNEANIRLIKIGQTATIRLEAFPNQEFNGIVKLVNDYPEPGSWMGGSMSKEYMTTITILNAPVGIKPGLTAEAKIVVNEIKDALLLPSQAVFEYGGKTYCITYHDGKWDKHEVETGPSNDKQVVILKGLGEGDTVVLGAWAHRDKVELPKLRPEEQNGSKNGSKKERRDQPDAPKRGDEAFSPGGGEPKSSESTEKKQPKPENADKGPHSKRDGVPEKSADRPALPPETKAPQ